MTMRDWPPRIIVATDFSPASERAVERAVNLASEHGGPLRLLHSTGEGDWLARWVDRSHGVFSQELWHRTAASRLAGLRERIAAAGVDAVEADCCSEPLGACLAHQIENDAPALLVMGSSGAGGMRRTLLGSTADRILRAGVMPVLLVRNPVRGAYERVLLATDFSESSRQAARLGLALAPTAGQFLLHASELPPDRDLAFAHLSPGALASFRERAQLESARALEDFAAGLGVAARPVTRASREGPPSQVLEDFVDEAGIDLVVLGARPRARWEANLLGSTALFAVNGLRCDVLLVPGLTPRT
jgi:nucleotide-binding universal stress UspA family protein